MIPSYWELVADEIRREGWSIGWARVATDDRLLWSADAHRDDGRRFIARAEELATAMIELQKMTREASE